MLLHVPDIIGLLTSLYQTLNPGGRILVVDFDKNEKISHDKVHNGFIQAELRKQFEEAAFRAVSSETFYQRENVFMNQDASMFILSAEK